MSEYYNRDNWVCCTCYKHAEDFTNRQHNISFIYAYDINGEALCYLCYNNNKYKYVICDICNKLCYEDNYFTCSYDIYCEIHKACEKCFVLMARDYKGKKLYRQTKIYEYFHKQ